MTNRPTDDFENTDKDEALDYGDDDAAAFGKEKVAGATAEEGEEFVDDDAADVLDPEAEQEYAEYSADELESDPLAEDAEPYPTTDEIYDGEKKKAGNLIDRYKSMKPGDKIFYGGFGVLGLVALYFVYSMTMGTPDATQDDGNVLAIADQPVATAPAPELKAPIANPAEPKPDAVGVQGAQSTLNGGDTFATLPQPVADTPPAEVQQVQQPAPVAAPVAAAPVPTQVSDEVKAQLEAQQAAMNALQTQIEQQQTEMKKMKDDAASQPPLTAVTTPPAVVNTNDPALNQVATDLGVRIAEVNAKLTQLSDALNNLQKTTGKLDKDTSDLQGKTKDLSEKVGAQSGKLNELANKEPPPSTDKAILEELKSGVSSLEKRVSSLTKDQQDLKTAQTAVAARAAVAQTVAQAAARPVMTMTAPGNTTMNTPAAQMRTVVASNNDDTPHSPKARAEAGMSPVTATMTTTPAATSTWVLRAATPTMAWLSPRPGSAELKRVAPGDTVEGIGQVLEIRQDAGRWIVVGTAGSVH